MEHPQVTDTPKKELPNFVHTEIGVRINIKEAFSTTVAFVGNTTPEVRVAVDSNDTPEVYIEIGKTIKATDENVGSS